MQKALIGLAEEDGSMSEAKKLLFDEQQRVTALAAAISGQYAIDKTCQRVHLIKNFEEIISCLIKKDLDRFYRLRSFFSLYGRGL